MGHGEHPFASLRDVARERRELEQDEPTWLARRAGALAADEERALVQKAESDAYVAHMLALTEPLDQKAEAELEQCMAALIDSAPSAKVVNLSERRRGLRYAGMVTALLACAAAALLIVRSPSSQTMLLPPYQGSLEGADREVRSAGEPHTKSPRQRISRGANVVLSVQPLEPVASPDALTTRLFLLQGKRAEPLTVPVQVSRQGALRASAPYDAWFGARTGAFDVLMFVGERSRLPGTPEQALEQANHDDTGLRVLRFPVELAP
jgi:hypothetical protein